MPLSGYLASVEWMGGWPLAFYVFGALGIVWSVVWWLIVFDSPASHPRISNQEKEYIQACLGPENIQSKVKIFQIWFFFLCDVLESRLHEPILTSWVMKCPIQS